LYKVILVSIFALLFSVTKISAWQIERILINS